MSISPVYSRIYDAVRHIPKGRVSTYAAIAKRAKTHPRIVGQALHRNPDPQSIPCHRVVNSKGRVAERFAFGGAKEQIKRLKSEGIQMNNLLVQEEFILNSF